MKTIKIIDLLNKIANEEEVPKLIKCNDIIYEFKHDVDDYWDTEGYLFIRGFDDFSSTYYFLNEEVEIIEEDKTHYTYKITKNENGTIVDAKGQRYSLIEEVETTEEEKEIEKLGYFNLCKSNEDGNLELTYTGVADTFDEVYQKINELIDAVNKIKRGN